MVEVKWGRVRGGLKSGSSAGGKFWYDESCSSYQKGALDLCSMGFVA